MAVRIRLKRMGAKHKPFYRLVVADSRRKRDGAFLDEVGYYNPLAKPYEIKVDEQKIWAWLERGAQVTDGAKSLLKKIGLIQRWEASHRRAQGQQQEEKEVSE